MNKQRQVIYSLRRDILEGANLQEELKQWLYDVSLFYIDKYAPAEEYQEKWELKELEKSFKEWLGVDVKIPEDREWDRKELEDHIFEQLEQFYKNKEEQAGSQVMREFERYITLQVLDSLWKEHLHMLDRLRESVYLRGYAQRDPLVEYKKEAFNVFEDMLFRTKQNTLEYLFKVQIASEEEIQEEQRRKEEETERLLKEATATTDEQEARKKKKKKKVIKYKNRMERRKRKK